MKETCPACNKPIYWWRANVRTDKGVWHHRCYHLKVAETLPASEREQHLAWLNAGGGLRPGYE